MLGKIILFNGLSCLLIGCSLPELDSVQKSSDEVVLQWPEDYKNLGAPEGFDPPDANFRTCVKVDVQVGVRYINYPATYKVSDEWVTTDEVDLPSYQRRWIVVKPEQTIELILGTSDDDIHIPEENICQE